MARLVVSDRDVEGVKEVCEFGGSVVGEGGAEVGDRREERFDLLRLRFLVAVRFELALVVVERGALAGEFLDADLRGGDDGMVRVVVLFEAERLPADRLVEVGELPDGCGELCRAAVVAVGERGSELVVKKTEAVGPEEAAAEEVEERFEDDPFEEVAVDDRFVRRGGTPDPLAFLL